VKRRSHSDLSTSSFVLFYFGVIFTPSLQENVEHVIITPHLSRFFLTLGSRQATGHTHRLWWYAGWTSPSHVISVDGSQCQFVSCVLAAGSLAAWRLTQTEQNVQQSGARFDVVTAMKIPVTVFWILTQCSDERRFGRPFCLPLRYPTGSLHGVRTQEITTSNVMTDMYSDVPTSVPEAAN